MTQSEFCPEQHKSPIALRASALPPPLGEGRRRPGHQAGPSILRVGLT